MTQMRSDYVDVAIAVVEVVRNATLVADHRAHRSLSKLSCAYIANSSEQLRPYEHEKEHLPHVDELIGHCGETQASHVSFNLCSPQCFHLPRALLRTNSHYVVLFCIRQALLWIITEYSLVFASHVPCHAEQLQIIFLFEILLCFLALSLPSKLIEM